MRLYPQAGLYRRRPGGWRIKRILRSRLPERLRGKLPPLVVEAAVALAVSALMTLLRVALVPWTGDRAPFAFVFVAVVGATVLAGWRSGLLATVIGQALAWDLIIDAEGYADHRLEYLSGFAVATLAQLLALVIIALYQREVDRAWAVRESQLDLLGRALAEIDHRTINNYQAVQALILSQAQATADGPAKEALLKIADRIKAVSNASRRLAATSDSLEMVRPAEHLQELCAQIERGLSRRGVAVECHFADVSLGPEETTSVSLLINELVTNALKHAFPGDREGVIRVSLAPVGDGLDLEVADNGIGIKPGGRSRSTGLGTRLVKTFVKQLRATHKVESSQAGTQHRIHIPGPA